MMKRRFWSNVMWASVLVLLLAPQVLAAPIVTVTVTQSGGFFDYTYTVENPTGSSENIYDFALAPATGFAGEPTAVTSPFGWTHISFFDIFTNLGSIDWYSLGPSTDLVPGASPLVGFSFRSLFGPGVIEFVTLSLPGSADPTDPNTFPTIFAGQTTGPVQAVPEPSTLWLMAAGLAVLWRTRHRGLLARAGALSM